MTFQKTSGGTTANSPALKRWVDVPDAPRPVESALSEAGTTAINPEMWLEFYRPGNATSAFKTVGISSPRKYCPLTAFISGIAA